MVGRFLLLSPVWSLLLLLLSLLISTLMSALPPRNGVPKVFVLLGVCPTNLLPLMRV
jgi:hypothetical protein